MSGRAAPIPPWAKPMVVAAVLAIVWILGQTIGRVLIVFIVSTILALLLNPLVRMLRRLHLPRGLAVATVFIGFAAAFTASVWLVISPIQSQVEEIQQNLPAYTDQAKRQADSLQRFFDERGIDIDVEDRAGSFLEGVQERASEAADNIVDYSLDALGVIIMLIVIIVAAIYMLLDAPRIARFAGRIMGPETIPFLRRTERTLTEYVKAQLLVSLIIATSAGAVLWAYGVADIFPLGATFAVAFAAWVFVMEFIPYVGPILGAVPPTLLALFTSPLAALWVVIAFLAIHQLEGHVVVPKVMGSAVGVHPLVVIFGLLIGEQLAGILGVLLALPMVVIVKESTMFAIERLGLDGPRPATAPAVPEAAPQPPPEGAAPPAPAAPGAAVVEAAPPPATGTRELPTRPIEGPGLRPER